MTRMTFNKGVFDMNVSKMWICGLVAVVLLVASPSYAQTPLGTAFTYQGQLKDGGIPADEDYDFLFKLFEAETGGAQVGGDIEIEDWPVPDGLFTVQLDFGEGVFTGDALWLEVGVRLGVSEDPHIVLSPRQPLTATPYALYALSGPGSGGFWAANADDIYNTNSGQVGIGTTSPTYPLHVVSDDSDAVYGESSVSGGVGVYGKANSFEGGGFGLRGDSYGTTGIGVFGIAAMGTGNNYGVYGQSQSQTGRGVYGFAASTSGVNYGVYGASNSPDGWAGYFSGRSYFDGTVQMTGFQLLTSPADGYVLTSDAAGVGSWQQATDSLWLISGDDIYYNGGNVGIGTASPDARLDIAGYVRADTSSGAGYVWTYGYDTSYNAGLSYLTGYPLNGYVSVRDANSETQAGMYVTSAGHGHIWADTKNFRVANPNQRGTEIWYACPEGPEAAAYIRGTAHLVDGRATVAFPDHFTAVATSQGMTVQITPHSAESKGLAVVERSVEGFVVRELFSGAGTYDFDYTVMAVRQGHEDYRVIRPDTEGLPAGEIKAGDADGLADTEVR